MTAIFTLKSTAVKSVIDLSNIKKKKKTLGWLPFIYSNSLH